MFGQDDIEVWDEVEANGHKGVVTHIHRNGNGDRICNVRFNDKNLMPPEMEFPDYRLKHVVQFDDYWNNKPSRRNRFYGPVEDFCPKCGTKWTITKFNKIVWKDCSKCKKTFEQLTKDLK